MTKVAKAHEEGPLKQHKSWGSREVLHLRKKGWRGCQETIKHMGASVGIIWFVVLWFLIGCFFTELGLAT